MTTDSDHAPPRLAILGAGPTGLEAALAAAARGWPFTVYERAAGAGGHVRAWGHVRLFTPWSMNVSPAARAALGESAPDGPGLPTGAELADELLVPLAARLGHRVRTGAQVVAVGRDGLLKHEGIGSPARARRPFRLLVRDAADGSEGIERADVVLDATGTYGNPNALGDGGIPAPGEGAAAGRIRRELPDLDREAGAWAGKRILLTGAGHSAQTAARALAGLARDAPGTRVHWAVRSPAPDWSAVAGDPLPERARLSAATRALAAGASGAVAVDAGAVTEALAPSGAGGRVRVTLRGGAAGEIEVDRILALNGGVGDFTLYRQLHVAECYATCGPINLAAALLGEAGGDCLTAGVHGSEVLRNPEAGFFILGAKSYGRDSRFLLGVGWQQVADVFALLDADHRG